MFSQKLKIVEKIGKLSINFKETAEFLYVLGHIGTSWGPRV